ncbi:hypothetical protein BGZ49_001599 [Haplosporangium sp. Z 27]|nr:hypothetical protein BGZ49_001599 [Haplosporangium sp. Z 27]
MNDQQLHTIRQFGEFAMRIREATVKKLDDSDVEIVKSMMELGLNKRELPSHLGRLFNTYDSVTVPYELYYNIISGHLSAEKSFLNPLILRVLCCDGSHEQERNIILSSDEVSEDIKNMVKGV